MVPCIGGIISKVPLLLEFTVSRYGKEFCILISYTHGGMNTGLSWGLIILAPLVRGKYLIT